MSKQKPIKLENHIEMKLYNLEQFLNNKEIPVEPNTNIPPTKIIALLDEHPYWMFFGKGEQLYIVTGDYHFSIVWFEKDPKAMLICPLGFKGESRNAKERRIKLETSPNEIYQFIAKYYNKYVSLEIQERHNRSESKKRKNKGAK